MIEHLTKKTQNKWGSEVAKFFYELYAAYLLIPQGYYKQANMEYKTLAWNCAWTAAQMLYDMRKANGIKKTAKVAG